MRVIGRAALLIITVIWLVTAFGINERDAGRGRLFLVAVDRWQTNPDFRKVAAEDVLLGSDAMRGRVIGAPADRAVMAFRSLPGLPPSLAASEGSTEHYRDFALGPLSAYLHLIGEQGLTDALPTIDQLGTKENISDDNIRAFLQTFKLRDNTIAMDSGAIAGVRAMLTDIDVRNPLMIREDPRPMLAGHIATIAKSISAPIDPTAMTWEQQREVYLRLDDEVRRTDPQLWRTKQLVDVLCGIWGQAYGQTYAATISPTLMIRGIARDTLILPIAGLLFTIIARRTRRAV